MLKFVDVKDSIVLTAYRFSITDKILKPDMPIFSEYCLCQCSLFYKIAWEYYFRQDKM